MNTFYGGTDGGYYPCKSDSKDVGYTDGSPFLTATEFIPIFNKDQKILGYTYGYMANRGEFRSPRGRRSQELLYQLNNNWICLTVTNYQKTYHSTDIYSDHMRTPTDRDVAFVIEDAHRRNVKVCLKPMLNSDDNVWRAHIGFPDLNMNDLNIYWAKWFESYKNFILHYAELAQELKVEMFCIGCEMLGTEHRKYDWLYLIKEIRRVYTGKIVYNTNHDHEDAQDWFDELDYIGTSAYYPVGGENRTYDEMVKGWTEVKWRLNAIAESRKKKYIFMEIGCRSVEESSQHPWDFTQELPWSEEEQYNYYKSCFDVFINEPNFAGVFWWDWPTFQYETREEALKDKGFNIHLKAAEELVKETYKKYRK